MVGHVLGVMAAHDRAVESYPAANCRTSQIPFLAVMVVYTVVGLGLLLAGWAPGWSTPGQESVLAPAESAVSRKSSRILSRSCGLASSTVMIRLVAPRLRESTRRASAGWPGHRGSSCVGTSPPSGASRRAAVHRGKLPPAGVAGGRANDEPHHERTGHSGRRRPRSGDRRQPFGHAAELRRSTSLVVAAWPCGVSGPSTPSKVSAPQARTGVGGGPTSGCVAGRVLRALDPLAGADVPREVRPVLGVGLDEEADDLAVHAVDQHEAPGGRQVLGRVEQDPPCGATEQAPPAQLGRCVADGEPDLLGGRHGRRRARRSRGSSLTPAGRGQPPRAPKAAHRNPAFTSTGSCERVSAQAATHAAAMPDAANRGPAGGCCSETGKGRRSPRVEVAGKLVAHLGVVGGRRRHRIRGLPPWVMLLVGH